MHALATILSAPTEIAPIGSMAVWWARNLEVTAAARSPLEAAILGGYASDRAGYAFAAGYEAALRALVPDLPREEVVSLCVTERGGAHPAVIATRLSPSGGGKRELHGHKRWATMPAASGLLLVAATEGVTAEGRSALRLVRVSSSAPGVSVRAMPETPFAPEITHMDVVLEGVIVGEEALLPGDGYMRYIKPFRTVEDIHVLAAALAYLVREARDSGLSRALVDRLAAALAGLAALAGWDALAPETHVALGGALSSARLLLGEVEVAWRRSESPANARWERDRVLFGVANGVREKRLSRAWEQLDALGGGVERVEGVGGVGGVRGAGDSGVS